MSFGPSFPRFFGDFISREAAHKHVEDPKRSESSSSHRSMATTAAAYRCRSRPSGPPVARLLPASPSPPPPPSPGRRLPMRSVIATSVGLSSAVPKLVCSPCRLRVSYRRRGLYVSACSGEVDSDAAESPAEATFEIKLPRRSLLVQFTCNKCGERTKRLINRVAYERGTVFSSVCRVPSVSQDC